MESKKLNVIWGISLFTIGIATIILAGSGIIGQELPDSVKIILCLIDLIALPVLVFTTVRKLKNRK
jgi:hypothetical protein